MARSFAGAASGFPHTTATQHSDTGTDHGSKQVNPQVFEVRDITAGPSDRAGFIDAPQIGPANIASSPITAPTAIPAVMPFSAAPVETPRITNIKIAVRISSRTNDWVADPEGTVVPSILFCGKRKCNAPLAARAPVH